MAELHSLADLAQESEQSVVPLSGKANPGKHTKVFAGVVGSQEATFFEVHA